MGKRFIFMSTEVKGKNRGSTKMRVVESLPGWYYLAPWKWGKVIDGGKYYNIRVMHPLRGGGNWRKNVLFYDLKEMELTRDDTEKIYNLLYFRNPNIAMPPPVPITKNVKMVEADYDLTKYKAKTPGKTELKAEVVRVKKLPDTEILWKNEPIV